MNTEWKKVQLKDCVTILGDGLHGTPKYTEDGEYAFINGNNLVDGSIKIKPDTKRVSKEEYEKYKKPLSDRTVLVSINGTLGNVAIYNNEKIILGKSACYFNVIDEVDKLFIKYIVSSPLFKDYLNISATGTTIKNISLKQMREFDFFLPPIKLQQKIASILSSLDEKIAVNNKINNNLEEQARIIFEQEILAKEELPIGWVESNLLGIADYLNGLAMQKFRPKEGEAGYPVLKIKELRQGFCDKESELCSKNIKPEYIIHDGDVIFSWSGSLLVDFWCGGTCGLNQHLFKVSSNKYDKWFYYAWTKYHLNKFIAIAADMATTMGHIKREELVKAKVLIPDSADYDRISLLLRPIYDKIINTRIENRKLGNLRDALLPKLMSGEIDIESLEL